MNTQDLILILEAVDEASGALDEVRHRVRQLDVSLNDLNAAQAGTQQAAEAVSMQFMSVNAEAAALIGLIAYVTRGFMQLGGAIISGTVFGFRVLFGIIGLVSSAIAGLISIVGGLIRSLLSLGRTLFTVIRRFRTWLMLIPAALIGGLTASVWAAARFEASLRRVWGVTGSSRQEIEALGKSLREVAKTSIFTAGQIAEAAFYLASAGWSREKIEAGIRGVTKLAETFGVDLAQAAELVVALLAGFGMQASDTIRVANALAAANARSLATFEKLQYALLYVVPAAKTAKMSLEEMLAALMALFNVGMRGEMAGAGLRMFILRLMRVPRALKEALAEAFGVAPDQVQRLISPAVVGLMTSLDRLHQAFRAGALDMNLLAKAFPARTFNVAVTLITQGADSLRRMAAEITGTNQAFSQAEMQMSSFSGTIKYLLSSLEELALVIGYPLLDPLRWVVKQFAELINVMSGSEGWARLSRFLVNVAWIIGRGLVRQIHYLAQHWEEVFGRIMDYIRIWGHRVAGALGWVAGIIIGLYRTLHVWGPAVERIFQYVAHIFLVAAEIIIRGLAGLGAALKYLSENALPFFQQSWEVVMEAIFIATRDVVANILTLLGRLMMALSVQLANKFQNWLIVLGALAPFSGIARDLLGKLLGINNALIIGGYVLAKLGEGIRSIEWSDVTRGVENATAKLRELWQQAPPIIRGTARAFTEAWAGVRLPPQLQSLQNLFGAAPGAVPMLATTLLQSAEQTARRWSRAFDAAFLRAAAPVAHAATEAAQSAQAAMRVMREVRSDRQAQVHAQRTLAEALNELTFVQREAKAELADARATLKDFNDWARQERQAREEEMRAQFGGFSIAGLMRLAFPAVVRRMIEGMPLMRALAMAGPNALGMTAEGLTGAVGGLEAVQLRAMAQLRRMSVGELVRHAQTTWRNYTEYRMQLFDAWVDAVRSKLNSAVSYWTEVLNFTTQSLKMFNSALSEFKQGLRERGVGEKKEAQIRGFRQMLAPQAYAAAGYARGMLAAGTGRYVSIPVTGAGGGYRAEGEVRVYLPDDVEALAEEYGLEEELYEVPEAF